MKQAPRDQQLLRAGLALLWMILASTPAAALYVQPSYNPGSGPSGNRYLLAHGASVAGELTVEAWVRAGTQTLHPFPVIAQQPAGVMLSGEANYALIVLASNGHVLFRVTTTAGNYEIETPVSILDNEWHHLAGVRTVNPGHLVLYVDGQQVGVVPVSGDNLTSFEPLGIGGLKIPGYVGNYLEGYVDEVRVWRVARTQSEITRDRLREISGHTDLQLAFHFDRPYRDPSDKLVYRGSGSFGGMAEPEPPGETGFSEFTEPAPILRGEGIDLAASSQITTGLFTDAAVAFEAADLPNENFAAAMRPLAGGAFSLEVCHAVSGGYGLLSSTTIPAAYALLSSGSTLFLFAYDGDSFDLYAYDATVPTQIVPYAGTAPVSFSPDLAFVDPVTSQYVFSFGLIDSPPGGEHYFVNIHSIADPDAVELVRSQNLNVSPFDARLVDCTKIGSKLYASFSDGMIRVFQHDVATQSLSFLGNYFLGQSAYLASIRGYLIAAAQDGTVLVFFPVAGAGLAFLKSVTVDVSEVIGVSTGDDRVFVVGREGLRVLDARTTFPMDPVAWFCTESLSRRPVHDAGTGRIYLACSGVGVYALVINSLVAVESGSLVGAGLNLVARPNPMRVSGTLQLHLPEAGEVRVEIFDLAGRRVRSLCGEHRPAGPHLLAWDGRDDTGRHVRSGVYLARARTETHTVSTRIVRLD